MSSPDIRMLESRMDKLEGRTENWDKIFHGMEYIISLTLNKVDKLEVRAEWLENKIDTMSNKVDRLEEGQVQLALAQVQSMAAIKEVSEKQGAMAVTMMEILNRIS